MRQTPMHKVEIVHNWKEINRNCSQGGSVITLQECQHCGVQTEALRLGVDSGQNTIDAVQAVNSASLRSTFDRLQKASKALKEMFEQLVNDSDFETLDDLTTSIGKCSQRVVDGCHLPYSELRTWVGGQKKHRAKNLLPYVQGPVCNRCDRVFSRLVLPTVDHINGDRSNAHPSNLQLLCEDCNVEKANNPLGDRDISPFTYRGPSCLHVLSCVELDALQEAK